MNFSKRIAIFAKCASAYLSIACCLAACEFVAAQQNSQPSTFNSRIEAIQESTVETKAINFAEGPAAKFSTTVNGRTHQQSPLITYRGFQYATYFDARRNVCLARRRLPTGRWQVIRFSDHKIKSNDSHNTAVIGICPKDGTIHMVFDHHASPLNYRISKTGIANRPKSARWDASSFSTVLHTLGSVKPARQVTYPRFFTTPDGNLMLFYRAVTSGNGDGMLEEYDGKSHDWNPGLGKVIARDIGVFNANGKSSNYRCAYMNSIAFAGKRLHATWIWRDRFDKTHPRNQHDLCYAYSDDRGRTWRNTEGKVIGQIGKRFIHLDSPGVVVQSIPTNSGLANQNTHFAYRDGSVHVVMRHSIDRKHASYQHYWRTESGKWEHATLPFSGQRPKLIGTDNKILLLAFEEDEQLTIACGEPNSDRTEWKWKKLPLNYRQSIAGEPLIDLPRWESEQILSVYGQEVPRKAIKTETQAAISGFPSALKVVDYRFLSNN